MGRLYANGGSCRTSCNPCTATSLWPCGLALSASVPNLNSITPKIWRSVMDSKTARIAALNDELRQNFAEGLAVMTPGIAALGAEAVARIVKTIAVFDNFCHANDPHEEHDFGAFDADGHTILFKIDYYDESLTYHSPDPADPSVTKRVITIMLAEEY